MLWQWAKKLGRVIFTFIYSTLVKQWELFWYYKVTWYWKRSFSKPTPLTILWNPTSIHSIATTKKPRIPQSLFILRVACSIWTQRSPMTSGYWFDRWCKGLFTPTDVPHEFPVLSTAQGSWSTAPLSAKHSRFFPLLRLFPDAFSSKIPVSHLFQNRTFPNFFLHCIGPTLLLLVVCLFTKP